ncbi:glutamate 5-kinase [Sphingobacteriaceae bacterium WQ 2009]|uniref:Glutamate 5-kinase n=1 Tax=Rhinopithecimicrobium faecis TaxID=2820698 RepID=A0A8T4HCV6_9SPHI|nr:glutamate 5-kinase [Sphingobacteriaceae bacterium WQ 2009]
MKKPILVIKFGSASITNTVGDIDERIVLEIARQVAQLQQRFNIVIVSSGAVAAGKKFLPNYGGTLAERKAAAAIGNPLLLGTYSTYFKPFKIALAQSLCERQHFANRHQFLQLKQTYEELWKNNIIPVANENDVVSNKELKFSDNDELATLIAVGFGAETILFTTSVPGVLDANNQVIPRIEVIDKAALSLARTDKSSVGLGGMTSKLNFARLANLLGIQAVIYSMETENAILKAVQAQTGTLCVRQVKKVSSRNKWLASGSLIRGEVQIDRGAEQALLDRNSLLAVGIEAIITDFESGEVFHILGPDKHILAVAKAKVDSRSLKGMNLKNIEVAHADDIVLL